MPLLPRDPFVRELFVGGVVVSGQLISTTAYMRGLAEGFRDGQGSPEFRHMYEDEFRGFADRLAEGIGEISQGEADHERRR